MPLQIKVDDILSQFKNAALLSDKGGQKIVYTIDHDVYGKCVLKIGQYSSQSTLERIKREVAILSNLKSEFFPINYEFRMLDSSRYLILEELISGDTLDKVFAKYATEKDACNVMVQLLEATSQLWVQNIIHRDLKPENIIISTGSPRILDLGIARVLDKPSLTCSFAPFGPCTPNYAAPEQLNNRKQMIDHRTDQFSLGILFGQLMLGGSHPFCPSLMKNGKSIPENILLGQWAKSILKAKMSQSGFEILEKMLGHEPFQRFRKIDDLRNCFSKNLGEL